MRIQRFWLSRQVSNAQLVRKLDKKRHRELLMMAFTGVVLAAAIIAYAWPLFEVIRLGYRMEDLREDRDRLLETRQHLELQRSTELAPSRIEGIAKEQLGMVYPDPANVFTVETLGESPSGEDISTSEELSQ